MPILSQSSGLHRPVFFCSISGMPLGVPLQGISGAFAGLHPIFTLSRGQVLRMAAQLESLPSDSTWLLFLAICRQVPGKRLIFTSTISPQHLPADLITRALPVLLQSMQVPGHVLEKVVPAFLLNEKTLETGNAFFNWLTLLDEYLTYKKLLSVDTPLEQEHVRAIQAARARKGRAFQNIANWAIDQMLLRCADFQSNGLRTLQGILLDSKPANLEYMQDLKGRMLDYLPERTVDDALRKRTAIEKVDAVLADALLIEQALGGTSASRINELAGQIASTYTIKGVLNSAALPAATIRTVVELAGTGPGISAEQSTKKTYSQAQISASPMLQRMLAAGKISISN